MLKNDCMPYKYVMSEIVLNIEYYYGLKFFVEEVVLIILRS